MPKVFFKQITLKQEVDWLWGFLFKNKIGWQHYIIKKHPELKGVFLLKNENTQIKFIRNYVVAYRQKNKNKIKNNLIRYETAWGKVEEEYFIKLAQLLNFELPRKPKKILALISLNPICPRFLDDWSFTIFYNYKDIKNALEVIMHECCHFLYFKKWARLYPRVSKKKYEYPYIEWHLSEIIAPIILNDKPIRRILRKKAHFYKEYNKIKIKGQPVPGFFTALYEDNIRQKQGFDDFLSKADAIIKKNKSKFKM